MSDTRAFPKSVTVYEVGPRDGLQNESRIVDTATKISLIERLAKAGLPAIEIGSFVRPDLIPALADSEEVAMGLQELMKKARLVSLVPNLKGLERALSVGVKEVAVFASATESFAQANLNSSIDESLKRFEPVIRQSRSSGVRVRGYISMCFGDPWEGAVKASAVGKVAEALIEFGVDELSLGDTIGVATPREVIDLLDHLDEIGIKREQLAVHFHDTYGQALANTLLSLLEGITTVDASVGGLGGCPFALSATGNLATEDLIWQLNGLGIETGVNLEELVKVSSWLQGASGIPIKSKAAVALMGKEEN